MLLNGWGRYPQYESDALGCSSPAALGQAVRSSSGLIARGNGRSYGDAAIGNPATLMCRDLNRMKSFDEARGELTVEAGVMLSDVLATFMPRGFFPPVVPGTTFVTVGGMIAADVHGKNHHRDGGFGEYVTSLKLVGASGNPVTCSRQENSELFFATIGGMGLTGVIAEATFRLKPIESAWISQTTAVASNLDEAISILRDKDTSAYCVAWIDCLAKGASLGRSLVFSGEHASREEVLSQSPHAELFPAYQPGPLSVPFDFPGWALNRLSVSVFNEIYFRRGIRKAGPASLVHWRPYFFPLDGIGDWNRFYGSRGFLQYQCVLPETPANAALADVLGHLAHFGKGSFLAVLKKLSAGTGMLSFPLAGYTLALDIPVSAGVFPLLDEIDKTVVKAGGRFYLAKDARQSRQTFEAGYPRLGAFRQLRREIDAEQRFVSHLSTRLGI